MVVVVKVVAASQPPPVADMSRPGDHFTALACLFRTLSLSPRLLEPTRLTNEQLNVHYLSLIDFPRVTSPRAGESVDTVRPLAMMTFIACTKRRHPPGWPLTCAPTYRAPAIDTILSFFPRFFFFQPHSVLCDTHRHIHTRTQQQEREREREKEWLMLERLTRQRVHRRGLSPTGVFTRG